MMDKPTDNIQNNMYNGSFELSYKEDGVYLTVHSPRGGARVTIGEVLNKLTKKQVRNYNRAAVDSAVQKAGSIAEKIADAQEEYKIDASISLSISPDRMKANIIISPPEGGRMLSAGEILEYLKTNGIVFGIKNEVVSELSKNPMYNQQVLIAEGIAPENGINGTLEFHFDRSKDAKPSIMEDGRVNFRELNLIENVTKGKVLITAIPPTKGKPGVNIFGTDIPALDGKPAVLPRGKNVEISPDGHTLTAAIDGLVNYIDGKVSVFALYEVQADVDNSTGNINFIGNVLVRGNILSGFSVEAGGNIEVWGVVEGARIKAGGNIVLRRGMQGLGKGVLICDGDIAARYIEHSNIEAKGDIKAEAIMHSNVKCGNRLELTGKKGLLVGGSTRVGKEISAKVIGSPMSTVTEVEVGVDPTLRERYKEVKEEIKIAEADIKKAEQAIGMLRKLEQAGVLTADKKEILLKSERTREYYRTKLEELREEVQKLDEVLEQESFGRILIQSIVYPGTKVTIGTCMMSVRENLQYCSLYRDGADIRVGAYK